MHELYAIRSVTALERPSDDYEGKAPGRTLAPPTLKCDVKERFKTPVAQPVSPPYTGLQFRGSNFESPALSRQCAPTSVDSDFGRKPLQCSTNSISHGGIPVKKVIVVSLACLTLFTCATLSVLASGKNKINYEFSPDGRFVRATNPPSGIIPAAEPDAKTKKIFSNFSHYKVATYFSIWGNTIAQGGADFPFQTWVAEAFTPTADATVTKIETSAGRQSSGTDGFEISLYSDAAGIPGTVLQTVHVSTLPTYGQCCEVSTATFATGVPVTAGTQYWVVVSTTSQDTDIYAWAFNSSNMDNQLAASWCKGSSTYCGSNSGVWTPYSYVQLGFAVFGQ
jgi:hypothetical protein